MTYRRNLLFGSILAAAALYGTAASAQATRTWVSGVGDDANPCSRTAPCKTFAGAISKTATGGEINCLDPGGFGGVTITKSLAIVCDYTEGGILSAGAGVNGIVINIPVTSHVLLSGLDLHGAGNAQNGIRIVSGGTVTVQNSIIQSYRASNGLGMSVQPAGALQLNLSNMTIANNGSGATGGGILIQPTGAGGNANVSMTNVRLLGNATNALLINSTGNTGTGIGVTMESSQIAGSATGINVLNVAGTAQIGVMVNGSTVVNHTGTGILVSGAGAAVRVGDTTITNNGQGVSAINGATLATYSDNRLDANPNGGVNNGSFSVPIPKK